MSISRKSLEIAYSILNFSVKHGFPPTTDEVRNFVGLRDRSSLYPLLTQLKEEGIIDWEMGESRTLRVLRPDFVRLAYLQQLAEERTEYIYRSHP